MRRTTVQADGCAGRWRAKAGATRLSGQHFSRGGVGRVGVCARTAIRRRHVSARAVAASTAAQRSGGRERRTRRCSATLQRLGARGAGAPAHRPPLRRSCGFLWAPRPCSPRALCPAARRDTARPARGASARRTARKPGPPPVRAAGAAPGPPRRRQALQTNSARTSRTLALSAASARSCSASGCSVGRGFKSSTTSGLSVGSRSMQRRSC